MGFSLGKSIFPKFKGIQYEVSFNLIFNFILLVNIFTAKLLKEKMFISKRFTVSIDSYILVGVFEMVFGLELFRIEQIRETKRDRMSCTFYFLSKIHSQHQLK